MQVLLVVDDDVYQRLGTVVQHLCVGLVDEPVRVTILSRCQRDGFGDAVGPSRVVRPPRLWLNWRTPTASEVLEHTEMEPPDVVHGLSAELGEWIRAWCSEWDSALAVGLCDRHDVDTFCDNSLQADTFAIATTSRVEQALLERCPAMRENSRLVPHGLPAQGEPACLARPERIPAVVISCPLCREPGIYQIFHSLQALVRSGQELQLFLLSSGPAEVSYRRHVEQLGLRSFVTFAGPMSDWATLQDAMRSADFYILPSTQPRFSIHTLLAMASGLAVIAPAGTVADYLIEGKTASLFNPGDPRDLTRRWGTLLEDRSRARELAHGALDYVRAHHQASAMVTASAWIYRDITERHAAATAG